MKLAVAVAIPFLALGIFIALRKQAPAITQSSNVASKDQIAEAFNFDKSRPLSEQELQNANRLGLTKTKPDGTVSDYDRARPLTERELEIVRQFDAAPDSEVPTGGIVEQLRAKFLKEPFPENEKWKFGPAEDETLTEPAIDKYGEPVKRPVGIVRHNLRIARAMLPKPRGVSIESLAQTWRDRLRGIIDPNEIDVSVQAIYSAEANTSKIIHSSNPYIESAGRRFLTRVNNSDSRTVKIELLWIDKNDPEASAASRAFHQSVK